MQPFEKAALIAKCADDKKGKKLQVLHVGELTSIADYFVIVSGGSSTQVKAIADEVIDQLKLQGEEPIHVEGFNSAMWVLIDYADVVVHVFMEETRDFYGIERLWADAKHVRLADMGIDAQEE